MVLSSYDRNSYLFWFGGLSPAKNSAGCIEFLDRLIPDNVQTRSHSHSFVKRADAETHSFERLKNGCYLLSGWRLAYLIWAFPESFALFLCSDFFVAAYLRLNAAPTTCEKDSKPSCIGLASVHGSWWLASASRKENMPSNVKQQKLASRLLANFFPREKLASNLLADFLFLDCGSTIKSEALLSYAD